MALFFKKNKKPSDAENKEERVEIIENHAKADKAETKSQVTDQEKTVDLSDNFSEDAIKEKNLSKAENKEGRFKIFKKHPKAEVDKTKSQVKEEEKKELKVKNKAENKEGRFKIFKKHPKTEVDKTKDQVTDQEKTVDLSDNFSEVTVKEKKLSKAEKKELKTKNRTENKKERVEIIEKHAKVDKAETKAQVKEEEKKKKEFKQREKKLAKVTKTHSKEVLEGKIISTTNNTPSVEENVIELFDVKKSYLTGDLEYEVLKGVNLKIKKGTFVVILGPSGSGKTTLLNIISGLDKANQGDVFVAGYNLSLLKDSHLTKFRRDNVGFIFQQYNLLTNLTARENAEVGENLAKTKNKELGIDEIFKVIEMDEHMNKFPSQLSGGQQQRVSIGRALAKNPKILFCDEPTGALDEEMGRKVLEILLDVNKAYETSIIMVTHNPNFQYVANVVINVKNGKIISVKTNQNPMKPSEINWS